MGKEHVKDFLAGDHFAKLTDAELLVVEDGYATARMLVTEKHLNGNGTCQGGAIFTLADFACAAALNSRDALTVSATANITYVKPVMPGYIYAEARETVNHHRLPYAEVKVTNEQGEICAVFTSSGYRKQKKA